MEESLDNVIRFLRMVGWTPENIRRIKVNISSLLVKHGRQRTFVLYTDDVPTVGKR